MMRPSSTAIVVFAASIRSRIGSLPPEAEAGNDRQPKIPQIEVMTSSAHVEMFDRRTDRPLLQARERKAEMRSRSDMRGAIIDVMLDLVHSTLRIPKAPRMPCPCGHCMEIADQQFATGDADTRQLVISILQRLQMTEHEPAPDEVERLCSKRKIAHIRGGDAGRLAGLQHFNAAIDDSRKRRVASKTAPPRAAACLEQPSAAGRGRKLARQFIVDIADGCFGRVSRRPEAIGLARRKRRHCAAPSSRRCP